MRYSGVATGTQNAGLFAGGCNCGEGQTYSCTEEYNGSSWSVGGALITANGRNMGAGTQNASLSFGGIGSSAVTEEYNGTSWSASGNLIVGRCSGAAVGTQTSALSIGGYPSNTAAVQIYDGTSWSVLNDYPLITFNGNAAAGTSPSAITMGGSCQWPCTVSYYELSSGDQICSI